MSDDMDDLFRKAAEQYPLKTDTRNFDAVSKQLQQEEAATTTNVADKKSFNNRWLLLLLLLPLPFICTRFSNTPVDKNAIVQVEKQAPASIQEHTATSKEDAVTAKESNDALTDKTDALNSKTVTTTNAASDKVFVNKKAVHENSTAQLKFGTGKQLAQFNKALQSAATTLQHQQQAVNKEGNTTSSAVINMADSNTSITEINDSVRASNADTASVVAENKNSVAKKSADKKAPAQKGFYAGVIAGVDASTIKYQAINDKGFSLGVLAGYQINKTLSFETGLYWDKRKYYSKGEYFDKTRTGIGADVYVVHLDGYCNMFELPINVKLNFFNRTNSHFFATTGLSTYIIKKEKYNYLGSINGWDYEGTHQYKNSTTNWFSVMNFSAGYEHKFFNTGNIRIEPYYKLPLSGLGIGNMKITSFGVNIGITRAIK